MYTCIYIHIRYHNIRPSLLGHLVPSSYNLWIHIHMYTCIYIHIRYHNIRPSLLGHLVPSSYNLWMGSNKKPSNSGLHHDYHDNLYVLIKGIYTYIHISIRDYHDNLYVLTKGAACSASNGRK